MPIFARIEDNVVMELVHTEQDIAAAFHPALHFIETADTELAVGWRWTGSEFTAPPVRAATLHVPTLAELEVALAALVGQVAALRAQA